MAFKSEAVAAAFTFFNAGIVPLLSPQHNIDIVLHKIVWTNSKKRRSVVRLLKDPCQELSRQPLAECRRRGSEKHTM
jgi:hypothetical protein